MCRKNIFFEHIVSGGQIRLGLEHNDDDAAAENVQFVISGELLERKRQWVGHYKSAKCQQTCHAYLLMMMMVMIMIMIMIIDYDYDYDYEYDYDYDYAYAYDYDYESTKCWKMMVVNR